MSRTSTWRGLATALALVVLSALTGYAVAHDGHDHGGGEPGSADMTPVRADPVFMVVLNGGQAVPSTLSGGMGVGFLTLDRRAQTLSYNVTFSDLDGALTAVHVHAGAAGEVRKPHMFALEGPGAARNGTTEPLTRAQLRLLRRGQCYVNVHTDAHPDGEIRGQIVPIRGVR